MESSNLEHLKQIEIRSGKIWSFHHHHDGALVVVIYTFIT